MTAAERRPNEPTPILEATRTPEIWIPNFGLVVISGKPGAGTTSLAKRIAADCGIYDNLYRAGDSMREFLEIADRAPGFLERDQAVDKMVDDRVSNMVRSANIGRPAVAEAQIGTGTTTEVLKKMEAEGIEPAAPVIRVLLWATADVRHGRMYRAAHEKGETTTWSEIRENTRQREREDLQHWRDMYSWIGKDNPLEIGARDANGNKINDIEIDNTHYSADQTYYDVMGSLRNMRMVTRNPAVKLPPSI